MARERSDPPGVLFALEEHRAVDVLGGIGRYTVAASDPPWSAIEARVPRPERLVPAGDMDLA
ncbi:MAG TPA: hypothetical protein VF855_14585, partial [Acidimicrobiales bacterium]